MNSHTSWFCDIQGDFACIQALAPGIFYLPTFRESHGEQKSEQVQRSDSLSIKEQYSQLEWTESPRLKLKSQK